MGKNGKCQPLMNDTEGIVAAWSWVSVWCPGFGFSCAAWELWQSALADGSWRDSDGHIPFPAAAISIPIWEAVNGRSLFGGLVSPPVFILFSLLSACPAPSGDHSPSDCCSGGEEHSLLGSSVALTLQLMELFSLPGPSLSHNRSGNSIHFYFGSSSQAPSVPNFLLFPNYPGSYFQTCFTCWLVYSSGSLCSAFQMRSLGLCMAAWKLKIILIDSILPFCHCKAT